MTIQHLTEDDLVLHYYGELPLPEKTAATAHLGSCATCRADYTRLQEVLGVLDDTALVVEPPPSFERAVWARLAPDLESERPRRGWMSWMLMSPAPLALAAAVVVLVVGAFFAGRALSPAPAVVPAAGTSTADQIQERILLVDVGEHLDRSQMALVELVSTGDDDAAMDIAGERARAEQLVADTRLYRQTAEQTGDVALTELLDEIERVLTEVAASADTASSRDLADVRRRIESRDLLFKVRVVSSEVRERQKAAVRPQAGPRS